MGPSQGLLPVSRDRAPHSHVSQDLKALLRVCVSFFRLFQAGG